MAKTIEDAYILITGALEEIGSERVGAQDYRCPAHEDNNASLGVKKGDTQVVLNCQAGCLYDKIIDELGLTRAQVRVPLAKVDGKASKRGTLADMGKLVSRSTFVYRDADGTPVINVYRRDFESGKRIAQGPGNTSKPGPIGVPWEDRPLYRLPELIALRHTGGHVWITEGETGADLLVSLGENATTALMGAKQPWNPTHNAPFAGLSVTIVADRDVPGYFRAREVARALQGSGQAASVRVVRSSITNVKGADIVDHMWASIEGIHDHPPGEGTDNGLETDVLALRRLEELTSSQLRELAAKDTGSAGEGTDEHTGPETSGYDPAELTDASLAPRIARELAEAGQPLRWSSSLGWLCWDGKRWRITDETTPKQAVMQWALALFDSEFLSGIPAERTNVLRGLLSEPRARRLVNALKAGVRVEASELNVNPDLLNTQSGVVNLRTGELSPHDPNLLMTNITRVAYVPGVSDSNWTKALEALEPLERNYLLARLGQAITGHQPSDDKVVFLDGKGSNGKTTLMTPVIEALGDYAKPSSQSLLLGGRSEGAQPELMALRGVRLTSIEELPETGRLNTQRLKTVAGTENITGRNLYKDPSSFKPEHALFVSTNHLPTLEETDHGTWRRLIAIRFDKTFTPSPLRERLHRQQSLEAVLATLIEYAGHWYRDQKELPPQPEGVEKFTQQWRDTSDVLAAYISDRLILDSDSFVSATELSGDFNQWLEEHNHRPWSDRLFWGRIDGHPSLGTAGTKRKRRTGAGGFSSNCPSIHSAKSPISVCDGVRFAP